MRTWVEGDDKILFASQSIIYAEAGASPDHVRAKSWNGIILEKVENGTKITFLGYVDPQGWVPHPVLLLFRGKITERIATFREMVKDRDQNKI